MQFAAGSEGFVFERVYGACECGALGVLVWAEVAFVGPAGELAASGGF